MKEGTERLNFTAFYEVLPEALAPGFCLGRKQIKLIPLGAAEEE
jgi:hypothetical protein